MKIKDLVLSCLNFIIHLKDKIDKDNINCTKH